MRFRLLCTGVVRQFLRRPGSFLALYVLWFVLRLIARGGSDGSDALSLTDSAALTGCLSALSLQSALMLLRDRDGSVLFRLKAAGAGHLLLFSAFQAAMLLAGAAACCVFCLFLFTVGLPFRWTVLLLPVAAALPSLFYSSLGMLCGCGLSRNGIWFLCVFFLTLTAAAGSGLFIDWQTLAPGVYAAVRYLPVNVYAALFRAAFSPGGPADPALILLPAGYTLIALACASLGVGRCFRALKQKDL